MTEKKLSDSPLRPGAPNYCNARGREASRDHEGIEEENNPGVSPGSVPEPVETTNHSVSEGRDVAQVVEDRNYAQYMNRGDGRYVKFIEDQSKGSFWADEDDGEKRSHIERKERD